MSSLQEQINQILAARKERLSSVVKEKDFWNKISENFSRFSDAVQAAENQNPSLSGLTTKVRASAQTANDMLKKFSQLTDRFNRDDICIGIGGAARMGKSTFLQAVTGLGDDQIPTSDKFFTTAGRSLIVNATEAVAIADMHTERSFLEKVIAPMCKEIGIQAPASLEELKRLELPQGKTQQEIDVINRLKDTIDNLSSISKELTGQKQRRINIENIRDFVAYPDGGMIKAGKFMAVDKITIYAPFPGSEVKQLRVVDLPGLGEAGRNLAEVQTEGMQDVCDATLLMKRPDNANLAWTLNDTTALDAIKKASLLEDQTKYTAILANVDGDTKDRADDCVKNIENQLSKTSQDRHFEIIRCDARDRDAVTNKTMPEILRFLAKNLPDLDKTIFEKTEKEAEQTKKGLKQTLSEVKEALEQLTHNYTGNPGLFQQDLYGKLVNELNAYSADLKARAQGTDEEWVKEVERVTEQVKKWISSGCGFSSKQALIQKVENEVKQQKGQPNSTVNQLRIAFREQWEVIDEHLQERIAKVLDGFIGAIQKCTNSFVPEREKGIDELTAIRNQLTATAEKLVKAPDQYPGDDKLLNKLAAPLRRLAEFDIRFRFHLEPTLIQATDKLDALSDDVHISHYEEAETFVNKMIQKLTAIADSYSKAMQQSRTTVGSGALEKNKRLIAGAVKDPNVRNQLIAMLQGAVVSSLSFSPNKIFFAVIENAADAFLRFDNYNLAYGAWIRGYATELRETPTPAERAAMNAYIEASDMLNKIQ